VGKRIPRRHVIRGLIAALTVMRMPGTAFASTLAPTRSSIDSAPELPPGGRLALPAEVAGIKLPQSAIAQTAAQFSRSQCPDYLFNHCMRTFLFGAAAMQVQRRTYDADKAFAAAALHDLGLLPAFESKTASFEIDGANRAEQLMLENGLSPQDADVVWHAIVLHDVRFTLTKRQGAEAMLVAIGAGSDVDGPDATLINPTQTAEIVAAFPRLQFKRRFTSLAVDHCKRKPLSQRGTWLEGLCREQAPTAWTDTVEREIAEAPFSE
jgi:HD domain